MAERGIELTDWLDEHYITYSIRKDILVIPDFGRLLIQAEYDNIFTQNKDGEVVFKACENIQYLIADMIYYICFPFGNRWYYVDVREAPLEQQFHILRYVGSTPVAKHKCDFYPLGIHSGYEILNGSGAIKDWCAKAAFLGYKGLAVADFNTLAASLDLQLSAAGSDLRFCFGYSLNIRIGSDVVGAKVYSATNAGFRNLLRIQKTIAVDNIDTQEIALIDLLNYAKDNVLVFDKLSGNWLAEQLRSNSDVLDSVVDAFDGWVYFQVDLSEYKADRIDSLVLWSIKAYFDAFYIKGLDYAKNIRPVLIQDIYYLDKEDWRNKIVLNKIDTSVAHNQSNRQFLKTIDELYEEYCSLFDLDKYGSEVFDDMCLSTADIMENSNAYYDLTVNYMPQYEMTTEEKRKYGTNLNMFNQIIEDGFKRLVPEGKEEEYRRRVEYEKYVILSTDNVNYFLIQYDTLNWARRNGILTGIGRGSAGGCVLSYLMGITQIDPIRFNLLFERFLLPERGGLSAAEVTKMQDDIESDEYIELTLDDGVTYKFDRDALFLVKRGDETIKVYADELQCDDDIIFDRKDLLFTLKDESSEC